MTLAQLARGQGSIPYWSIELLTHYDSTLGFTVRCESTLN